MLPKRGFAKRAILDAVAPMWRDRFMPPPPSTMSIHQLNQTTVVSEIRAEVNRVVGKLCYEISLMAPTSWAAVRRALISIKGELASMSAVCGTAETEVKDVMRRIEAMLVHDTDEAPPTFVNEWAQLLDAIDKTLAVAASSPTA